MQGPTGPLEPVLERLDPLLRNPVQLTDEEFDALLDFVGEGLLDPAARSSRLSRFIPNQLPSGRPTLIFR
jgi:cytochrome c peroxidase